MKYLFLLLILCSCHKVLRDRDSINEYQTLEYKNMCNKECQEKFNTDVSWVGFLSGNCYCK